ncbi:hypothetical protein BD560DRAFT_385811 [Blakeslea trispora]|nr:hypothetical protein BD560DRAFT_385811 [Blakeslea trispora]
MMLLNLALVLLATTSTVKGQVTGRTNTACAYLNSKVYCFFGDVQRADAQSALDNAINVLDLANATGKTAIELQSQWKPVSSNTNGVDISPRQQPQASVLGDGRRIFFDGGYIPFVPRLSDPTIIYDAVDNKWTKGQPYSEPPYGPRQIYYGTGVHVPGKGVALFGGFEEFINNSWTTPSMSSSAFNFANNSSRTIGYTQVTYYRADDTNQPWASALPLTTWATKFYAFQKTIYDPVKQTILYMGGEYRENEQTRYNTNGKGAFFNQSLTFDTVNSRWNPVTLTGDVPSGPRYYYSLTLAPSTNRDVIFFGGENDDKTLNDYCFTLNLDTYRWKSVIVNAPVGTVLARSRHSAVLTTNDTLLMLWGVDSNRAGITSILMLNISDPYAISVSDKYYDPNALTGAGVNGNTPSNTESPDAKTGLGVAAKGGIAAGCIIAGIIVAVVVFIKRRKSKNNKNHNEYTNDTNRSSIQVNQEAVPIEVDWDKIEEKYTELPKQSIQHQTPNEFDGSDMGSTVVRDYSPRLNNESVGSPRSNFEVAGTPRSNFEGIGNSTVTPSSVDDIGRQTQPMILKPDVGHHP